MGKHSFIVILILTLSYSTINAQFIGKYKSADFNYFDLGILYLFGPGHYIGGNELTLNSDSTFIFKTCSVIETGSWYCKNDSMYLDPKTIRWRNDSLQEGEYNLDMPNLRPRLLTYKITKNGFYREVPLKDNNETIYSVDKLEKINVP